MNENFRNNYLHLRRFLAAIPIRIEDGRWPIVGCLGFLSGLGEPIILICGKVGANDNDLVELNSDGGVQIAFKVGENCTANDWLS